MTPDKEMIWIKAVEIEKIYYFIVAFEIIF
jgi:hypothetical protein